MPSPSDNTSKWKQLSEIDYFGLFIKNWLAFNSWYRGHHPNLRIDRDCMEAVKNTQDARNSAFTVFGRLITGIDREALSFRDNLDGFVTSLNRVTLTTSRYTGAISFANALIDKNVNDYQNLIRTQRQRNIIKLGSACVIDDTEVLFKGMIELIYQVRCLLFHGDLDPTDENHQIVRYAYLIINSIMKNL
jgi:hypothetical protein